jgi:hypothetical protein
MLRLNFCTAMELDRQENSKAKLRPNYFKLLIHMANRIDDNAAQRSAVLLVLILLLAQVSVVNDNAGLIFRT